MEREFGTELRTAIYSVIEPILQSNELYRGRIAVDAVSEQFALPRNDAALLVAEFAFSRDINAFPGNITKLPSFDPETPRTNTESFGDELHRRAAHFTLAYVEDATERTDNSVLFNGQYWLGNMDEETKELVGKMQENPDEVVAYIKWAFQNDPSLENILGEFTKRAVEGTLRPPSFEE